MTKDIILGCFLKKIKNKLFHDKISRKKFFNSIKRKDIEYDSDKIHYSSMEDGNNSSSKNSTTYNKKNDLKKIRIFPPKEFSFILNREESLKFFQDFFELIDKGYESIFIDMRKVNELTIEVLLYIISIDKINKKSDSNIQLKIKVPNNSQLGLLIDKSGFSKYFKCNKTIVLNQDEIFVIQDGETNQIKGIEDATTCADAVDFVLKYTKQELIHRKLFNALAEMMTNTDNHAYENEEFRNWYLFAYKVDAGIAFYFFDNGKGIINTAKKNLLEKALSYAFSLGHESLMEAVLNGNYRSATGLPYRNKGLPEIKDFLIDSQVLLPIILTNKIFCFPSKNEYHINKYNFRGSLFAWILEIKD